jgi:hypothetical protein
MSFQRKTRAGGKALYFYCSYEAWLAVAQKLTTSINDKKRNIGIISRIKITKNKFNGKIREIDLPIFYNYGVDDIGACVDFLIAEKHWAKSGSGRIDAREFQVSLFRDKLVEAIDSKDWTDRLHQITEKVWSGIEKQLEGKRKPKYGGE